MRYNKLIAAVVTSAWAVLSTPAAAEVAGGVVGCDASGSKQVAGALIGGVVGGVIGNNVVKKDQQAGTLVGAATGAAAGSYIGCQAQKKDAATAAAPLPPPASARTAYEDDRYDDRYDDRVYRVNDDWRDEGPVYRGHGVPPGLAKKPYGMPPGQAKKYYAVGERMPIGFVRDQRNYIYEPARYSLRAPPAGYRWVIYREDAYLVRTQTGVVTRVVRALLG